MGSNPECKPTVYFSISSQLDPDATDELIRVLEIAKRMLIKVTNAQSK